MIDSFYSISRKPTLTEYKIEGLAYIQWLPTYRMVYQCTWRLCQQRLPTMTRHFDSNSCFYIVLIFSIFQINFLMQKHPVKFYLFSNLFFKCQKYWKTVKIKNGGFEKSKTSNNIIAGNGQERFMSPPVTFIILIIKMPCESFNIKRHILFSVITFHRKAL